MGIGIVVSQRDSLQALALSVSMPAAQLSDDEQIRIAATIREIAWPQAGGPMASVGEAQIA
jgi:hypothetical protein